MADMILLVAVGVLLAVGFTARGRRRRRFREAAAPAGAAASVLRDVYAGRGTSEQSAAEFDPAPTTSMTLDGEDPLRVYGVAPSHPSDDAR